MNDAEAKRLARKKARKDTKAKPEEDDDIGFALFGSDDDFLGQ